LLEAQAESDSNTFADLELWIAEHRTESLRVEALAERVNMSARNFARAYSKKRGRTPAKAIEAIRVGSAQNNSLEMKGPRTHTWDPRTTLRSVAWRTEIGWPIFQTG
jgi:methylphosphotriester-DNA--protein-cysteine methyltransferase